MNEKMKRGLADSKAGRVRSLKAYRDELNSMPKPYLTKFAYGRWWFYVDTRRKFKFRSFGLLGRPVIVVSYRKVAKT